MLVVNEIARASKISELKVHVLVDEDIFGFYIPVSYPRTMHVLYSLDELTEERSR